MDWILATDGQTCKNIPAKDCNPESDALDVVIRATEILLEGLVHHARVSTRARHRDASSHPRRAEHENRIAAVQ